MNSTPGKGRYRLYLLRLSGAVAIFFLWWLVHALAIFNPTLLPSPIEAFSSLVTLIVTLDVLPDIVMSILRMFAGFAAATIAGVLVGLTIGRLQPLYESLSGPIDFFRSIPVTTLYPCFVLMLGIGHLSKIGMVFWACFFVIVLNSAYGAIQASQLRMEMSQLFGATRVQMFRWIIFQDALPQTLIGLRVGLSYALIVEILCEMFMGSKYGIGQRVTEAWTTYAIDELYALILLAGLLGYGFNRMFVSIERRLIPWVA